MKEFYHEDLATLKNAVEEPVHQMIAVEVVAPEQTHQLTRQIQNWSTAHNKAYVFFNPNVDGADEIWERCRSAVEEWQGNEATTNLLVVGDESPPNQRIERAGAQLPTNVGFWRAMNQLRERWNALPAQIIFLVTEQQYFFFTTEADHLKRWMPLKLHCLSEPSIAHLSQQHSAQIVAPEHLTSDDFTEDDISDKELARHNRDKLQERLRLALQRGEAPNALARRYFLPLMAAAIALENWEEALNYNQRLQDIQLPLKPRLRWLRLRSFLEFERGNRAAGTKTGWQRFELASKQGNDTDKLSALWSLSIFYDELDEPDSREDVFRRAIAIQPLNTGFLGNYATFLAEKRHDYDRAEKLYKRVLELEPNRAETLGNYANFLVQIRHDYDKAEQYFRRALNVNTNSIRNLNNYATFLFDIRNDYDRARNLYLSALELSPDNAIVLGNYANLLKDGFQDHDESEKHYLRALDINPDDPVIIGSYATFLDEVRHKPQLAREYFLKVLEVDSDNPSLPMNYANFLAREDRDFDGAEANYKLALQRDANYVPALTNYAIFLYKDRGNWDEAQQLFARATELEPLNDSAHFGFALFLAKERKNFARAEVHFAAAAELKDQNPSYVISYGAVLLLQEKYDEGKAVLNDALKIANLPAAAVIAVAFHRYIHFSREKPAPLSVLKRLLMRGNTATNWDFRLSIEHAEKLGHPNLALLKAIAKVLAAQRKVSTLDVFPAWKKA